MKRCGLRISCVWADLHAADPYGGAGPRRGPWIHGRWVTRTAGGDRPPLPKTHPEAGTRSRIHACYPVQPNASRNSENLFTSPCGCGPPGAPPPKDDPCPPMNTNSFQRTGHARLDHQDPELTVLLIQEVRNREEHPDPSGGDYRDAAQVHREDAPSSA